MQTVKAIFQASMGDPLTLILSRRGRGELLPGVFRAIISFFLALTIILTPGLLSAVDTHTARALNGATVAVYAGRGAWAESVAGFKHFLDWKGISWEEVRARDINSTDLGSRYKVLFMPGGYAAAYSRAINEEGLKNIRRFVENGGGYIGACAGAYFASDYSISEGLTYDYPLDLFTGYLQGADQEIGYGEVWLMTLLRTNKANVINAYEPGTTYGLYYGGPSFHPNAAQPVEILSRYETSGAPAAINFDYGAGRVVLLGTHPEIDVDSEAMQEVFKPGLNQYGSGWSFLWTAMDWLLGNAVSRPPKLADTTAPQVSSVTASAGRLPRGTPLELTATVTDNDAVQAVTVTIDGHDYQMRPRRARTVLLDQRLELPSFSLPRSRRGAPEPAYFEKSLSTGGFRDVEVTYVRPGLAGQEILVEWSDGAAWNYLERPRESETNGGGNVLRTFRLPGVAAGNTGFKVRFSVPGRLLDRSGSLGHIRVTARSAAWRYSFDTTGLAPGRHIYRITAVDFVGNVSAPVEGAFTIR